MPAGVGNNLLHFEVIISGKYGYVQCTVWYIVFLGLHTVSIKNIQKTKPKYYLTISKLISIY